MRHAMEHFTKFHISQFGPFFGRFHLSPALSQEGQLLASFRQVQKIVHPVIDLLTITWVFSSFPLFLGKYFFAVGLMFYPAKFFTQNLYSNELLSALNNLSLAREVCFYTLSREKN